MLLWSYFAAFLTEPGRVPTGWSPFASDEVRWQILRATLSTQVPCCGVLVQFLSTMRLGLSQQAYSWGASCVQCLASSEEPGCADCT